MILNAVLLSLVALSSPASSADAAADHCRFDGARSAVRYAVTSFGAEGVGDDLYVFSGHVGRTHAHSRANLDPHFVRYGCDGVVETLPSGGAVQGTALVAFEEDLIAVAGLTARNATADEPEDLVSIASVRRFDRSAGRWVDLPDLPQPRSSHDAVVLGTDLYVVGGWQLRGAEQEAVWTSEMAVLDLAAENPSWRMVDQPFRTRALAVTHDGSRLVVVGGMGDDEKVTTATHLFDPASATWARGPDLPAQRGLKGFGLAAEYAAGRALVSPADGRIYALDLGPSSSSWRSVAELDQPRFFHELALVDGTLYAVAGTSRRAHLDSVEEIDLAAVANEAQPTPPATASARWAGFRQNSPVDLGAGTDLAERWRTDLAGYGQSTPVIWSAGDRRRVYLTAADGPDLETQYLFALDLDSGAVDWLRSFDATERFENSDMIARAASTPVVDAERIYALFGSGDLIATDHSGQVLWTRDLATDYGSFGGNHGVGTSVVRTAEAVVVSIARKTYAYVLALDPATGATRWKTDREAGPGWTTPVLIGRDTLLVSGTGRLEALDSSTGEVLWTVSGLGGNNVSSPAVRVVSSDDGDRIEIAVAATRTGGVSLLSADGPRERPKIVWQNQQSSHYSAPVFHGPCLLTSNKVGALFCYDASTGVERWRERLAGPVWATPLETTDGALLVVSEKGAVQRLDVSSNGADLEVQRDLEIDGRIYGVSAASAGWIVARSGATVVAISASESN